MTKALALVLLLARTALAGPSTTFVWSESTPLDGESKTAVVGTSVPSCTSWVPVLGITNARSLTGYINAFAPAGSQCDFGIYDATGTIKIASTGPHSCDGNGVFQVSGLPAFSLAAGTKVHRCWCGQAAPTLLGYNENFGGDFGRAVKNTLSVPLRFQGSKTCKPSGALPDDIGTFSAADVKPVFVLIGTGAP